MQKTFHSKGGSLVRHWGHYILILIHCVRQAPWYLWPQGLFITLYGIPSAYYSGGGFKLLFILFASLCSLSYLICAFASWFWLWLGSIWRGLKQIAHYSWNKLKIYWLTVLLNIKLELAFIVIYFWEYKIW